MPKEINLTSPKIDRVIFKIEDGEIKIPPLQRAFVWKLNQIIELFESIYNDYPIGSILLWESHKRLPAMRNIAGFKLPDKPKTHPIYYVLDGQQRLASLYGVFCKERTIDDVSTGYKIDTQIFDIVFDLKDKQFLHSSERKQDKNYIEMKILFDPVNFNKATKKLSEKEQDIAAKLQSIFANYEIPIINTKKRDLQEVGIIFERVNNTGTKLDLFDLMVAWSWTPDFHLKKSFDSIFDVLKKKNFDSVEKKIVLQCLSGIIKKSSKSKVIISLNPKEIKKNIDLLKSSLEKTIDYLSTQLSIKTRDLLPHSHQLVPLCYFFSKENIPTVDQDKTIKEWFWKTSFSKRYSASTDTHIDEDIFAFNQLISKNKTDVFKNYEYSITEEQLVQTLFRKSNAFTRALVILLAQKNPLNLINGAKIDIGEALSGFNKREFHHLFPKNFLKKRGIDNDAINSLCNVCILPSDSNKKILDNPPSEYFKNIPINKYKEILESNLLPLKQAIYDKNNYQEFLKERATQIVNYLDKQLI